MKSPKRPTKEVVSPSFSFSLAIFQRTRETQILSLSMMKTLDIGRFGSSVFRNPKVMSMRKILEALWDTQLIMRDASIHETLVNQAL
jgi:hypothetical protein